MTLWAALVHIYSGLERSEDRRRIHIPLPPHLQSPSLHPDSTLIENDKIPIQMVMNY